MPTTFIRLTGCPQRCNYCDTEYAFKGGELIELSEIVRRVAANAASHVTVTGGEPLAQDACHQLLSQLCNQAYSVSLETGGSLDIAHVDPRVVIVMDVKTPHSGEEHNNYYQNIGLLKSKDQVKFVICNREDYDWAKQIIERYQLCDRCCILFSPSWQKQDPTDLAEWILHDGLAVRMQVQLHKILWGEQAGR